MTTSVEQEMRSMIADRLSEYHGHRMAAKSFLDAADDTSCDCEAGECECSEPWERSDYVAAAQAEAQLANAAALAMGALVALWDKARVAGAEG